MALRAQHACRCLDHVNKAFIRFSSTASIPHYRIPTDRPPPYPHGPTLRYQRANTGLYGGATIQYGHIVSKKNKHKNSRVWIPNVQRKRLWSVLLGRFIRVKLSMRVLRTIDRLGGIDEYLIGSDTPHRIKALGVTGWRLRWQVMQSEAYQERVQKEREKLGLPPEGWRVAEKERIRRDRREGIALAQEYLDAIEEDQRSELIAANSQGEVQYTAEEEIEAAINQSELANAENEIELQRQEADHPGEQTSSKASSEDITDNNKTLIPEDTVAAASSPSSAIAASLSKPEGQMETELQIQDANHSEKQFSSESPSKNIADNNEVPIAEDAEAADAPPSPVVAAALAKLESHAFKINSHPKVLIKHAILLRQFRDTANVKREAQRQEFLSELDAAYSSHDRGTILRLYNKSLQGHHAKISAIRKQKGQEPLSEDVLKRSEPGPPGHVTEEEWEELSDRAAVEEAAYQRRREARLKKQAERKEEEMRLKATSENATTTHVEPEKFVGIQVKAKPLLPKKSKRKPSILDRVKEVVFRDGSA